MYDVLVGVFEENSDSVRAGEMSAYMRDQFDFYGIPAALRRGLYKDFIRQERKRGIVNRELCDRCWDAGQREFQYFVADYLKGMQKFLVYGDIEWMRRFVKSKQWWDTIDSFCRIIGDIGLVDDRVGGLMLLWSEDEDFWIRRVAILHQLGRKTMTDTELLEKILLNNFGSNEFFINKAIGWSLREYSKSNAAWVGGFIARNRDRMAGLSIREGSKYL